MYGGCLTGVLIFAMQNNLVIINSMKVSVMVHISCSIFLHCDHPSLLAVTGNSICDIRSFSACTNSIRKQQDLQHFMFEQI